MNTAQKISLTLGIVAILANGLYPPFQGEIDFGQEIGKKEAFIGYRYLFAPPSHNEIYSVVVGKPMPDNYSILICLNAHVVNERVWLQFATITAATLGLLALFASRSKKGTCVSP